MITGSVIFRGMIKLIKHLGQSRHPQFTQLTSLAQTFISLLKSKDRIQREAGLKSNTKETKNFKSQQTQSRQSSNQTRSKTGAVPPGTHPR